jgi:hypothetical protein
MSEPKPYYWHGNQASWDAWQAWLESKGLSNGGSQAPDTIWQAAFAAGQRTADNGKGE